MSDDRTLQTSRTFPYSAMDIFAAFAAPEILATWWGPDGFSNTFDAFNFSVGGRWTFVMHGPDGINYPNKNIFAAIEPGSLVVIRHDCAPFFTLSVHLTPVAAGTRIDWVQVFDDSAFARAVQSIVEPANEQNLDRLTSALGRAAAAHPSI